MQQDGDGRCSKTGMLIAARWGWEVQQDGDAGCSKMGMVGAVRWGC